jgi:hypothetical protein
VSEAHPYNPTPEEFFSRIDGKLLKAQRSLLYKYAEDPNYKPTPAEHALVEGIVSVFETIADVCHDDFGLDTLFTEEPE